MPLDEILSILPHGPQEALTSQEVARRLHRAEGRVKTNLNRLRSQGEADFRFDPVDIEDHLGRKHVSMIKRWWRAV
jgi:hypothetical protein